MSRSIVCKDLSSKIWARASLVVLWLTLSACAGGPQAPRELLDDSTGETLLVSGEPVVFARDRTDVAANARDYLSALAVREDHSGKYSTWLVVYRWSTVDERFGGASGPNPRPLHVMVDDRVLTLPPLPHVPAVLASSGIPVLADVAVSPSVHAVSNDEIRAIAAARELTLRYDDDYPPLPYRLWKDGRPSMRTWLARTSPAH